MKLILVILFCAVGLILVGGVVGRQTANKDNEVEFSWIIRSSPYLSPEQRVDEAELEGEQILLMGTRGRVWDGTILLRSCVKYTEHSGYVLCSKKERSPNQFSEEK